MRIESLFDLHSQFPDIDGFWSSGDLSSTESTIRLLLPRPESEVWNSEHVEALIQLVRVLDLQGRFDESRVELEIARGKIDALPATARPRLEIRLTLEQGRHLCLMHMPSKAQDPFSRAWKQATEHREIFFAIEAALLLSISQPPKFQNEWLQRALALAEKSDSPQAKLWLIQLHHMNGWHSFDFRRFEEALESFEKALALPREKGERTSTARIKWSIARTLRALNQVEKSLALQRELLTEFSETGQVNGHVFLEIAECLQLLQKKEDAKIYFEMAYKELSTDTWYSDNKSSDLKRMQYIYKLR